MSVFLVLAAVAALDAAHAPETRKHQGVPSVAVSKSNGRMWCTYYADPLGGENHLNYCVLATSADDGRSWKEVLVADPDGEGLKRAFDPEVWIAPDGKLLWTWTERTLDPAKTNVRNAWNGLTNVESDMLHVAELDAENEPTAPYPPVRALMRGVMMCKPTVTGSGEWVFPLCEWSGAPSSKFYVTRNGRDFEQRGGVTLPEEWRQFDEEQIVELSDGRWWALIRTKTGLCESCSSDRGRTWSAPVVSKLGHPNSRLFITRLPSGNLLLVKHGKVGEEPEGGTWKVRKDLRAFVSSDDGKTWEGGLLLDGRTGVAYPDGDIAKDGMITVVYDHNRTKEKEILMARFTEEDARRGENVSGRVLLRQRVNRPGRDVWQVRDEELPKLKDWMGMIVNHPIDTNQVLVADPPKDMALFLLVGQSNMAGRGTIPDEYRQVLLRAYKFNRDGQWAAATAPLHDDRTTAGAGLGDSFIRAYLKDHPNANVGVIPCAIGGSHSALWSPEPQRGLVGANFHRAVKRAKAAMANGRIVGILWHQGEADVSTCQELGSDYYPVRIAEMVKAFRRELGEPDVPFVLGETGSLPKGNPAVINPLIARAAERIPLSALAPASDLTGHMPDGIHFDTPSYDILGRRYYAAWKRLAETLSRPAWNANAVSFLYAPAFQFAAVPNAERYRYRVIGADGVLHDFTSPTPTVSLASIWDELPTGRTEVWCEGYNGRFHAMRRQYRSFWKSAPWRPGAYPKPPRSFDEAVRLGYDYLLNLPFLQTFVATGRPDPAYRLNCYPAKMHAATVRAMVRLAKKSPDRRERALLLARTAADYLLSISQPADAPLAFFPPTYAGDKLSAKRFAGMNMLIHPAEAGSAYVALYGATQEAKYLAAAENIARTYMRLQGADGTWYLKLWEKDGTPVNENRLLPMSVINFFDDLAAATGKAEYTAVADRAFGSYEAGPIRTWNWEGQFEDVTPDAAYVNLQSHAPLQVARRLLRRWPKEPARVQLARELIDFVEDQFCYWERPYKRERLSLVGPKWEDWEVEPAVVEQYHYREVTDASTAALAGAFAALARVTGDTVARGKARTLGEACVRMQRPNGRIPTLWSKPSADDIQEDWINCMAATLSVLEDLGE